MREYKHKNKRLEMFLYHKEDYLRYGELTAFTNGLVEGLLDVNTEEVENAVTLAFRRLNEYEESMRKVS